MLEALQRPQSLRRLVALAENLTVEQLRSAQWTRHRATNRWSLTTGNDGGTDAAEGRLSIIEVYRRLQLVPTGRRRSGGRLLCLAIGASEEQTIDLASELAQLPHEELSIEAWRVPGLANDVFGVALSLSGRDVQPTVPWSDGSLRLEWYREDAGMRGWYLPIGFVHPWQGRGVLERAVSAALGDPGTRACFWRDPTMPAVRAARTRAPEAPWRMDIAIDADLIEATPSPDGPRERPRIQLHVTQRFDGRAPEDVAEVILQFDQPSRLDPLPVGMFEVIDRAQSREWDPSYAARLWDEASPTSGISHFIRMTAGDARACTVVADERFELPRTFRDAGLRVFVSEKCRFRPDLEKLIRPREVDAETINILRAKFGLVEDADVALVSASAEPTSPRVTVFRGEVALRNVIAPILERFEPRLEREAADALEAELPTETGRVDDAWRELASTIHDEAKAESEQFLAKLKERLDRAAGQLRAAHARCDGIEQVGETTRQALAQAVGSWVKLIHRVKDLHRALAQTQAVWAGEVSSTLAADVRGAIAKMTEAEEATAKLRSDIEGLSDAESRLKKLRGLAESESGRADQRLADLRALTRDAHAKAEGALERTPGVLAECEAARAVVEKRRTVIAADAAKLKAERQSLDSQRKAVEAELALREAERVQRQEAAAALKQKTSAMAAEIEQIEQLKRDAPGRQKELREAEARVLELQPDRAKAAKEQAELRRAADTVLALQDEIRDLRAEAAKLQPTVALASVVEATQRELTRQLDAMQRIIGEEASVRRATRALAKQVRKARRDAASGVARAAILRSESDRLRARIDELGASRIPAGRSSGERRSWGDRLRFWRRGT